MENSKIILRKNERIDDLEYKGLKIIQNEEGFCYGMDSVLLSDFAKSIKKDSKVLDLGTGTGILGILLCGKTQLKKIIGVEIQEEVAQMAQRSIYLNELENRFEILSKNIKDIPKILDKNTFDVVVTNPPYNKKNSGIINENKKKLISRHEIEADLSDFIRISAEMLKDKGKLYMVYRPERLIDMLEELRKYKLEPKRLRLVEPQKGKKQNLILVEAVKGAKPFLKMEPTLIVYKGNGNYTQEILKIYHKEEKE